MKDHSMNYVRQGFQLKEGIRATYLQNAVNLLLGHTQKTGHILPKQETRQNRRVEDLERWTNKSSTSYQRYAP